MPRYCAADVDVRLATTSVSDSTTARVSCANSPLNKDNLEKVTKAFSTGRVLPEQDVSCLNDDYRTRFLAGTPFLFVKTSPFQLTSETHASDMTLHVVVDFSTQSVLRQLDSSERSGIKFDIFFNGELSACNFIPARSIIHNTRTQMTFSGRRHGRLTERAWLLSNSPGTTSAHIQQNQQSPLQRWQELQCAILNQANRYGRSREGRRPPVAEYLGNLASMLAPPSLSTWQCSSRMKFGIIDIVISLGKGQKDPVSSGYCTKPTLTRNPWCVLNEAEEASSSATRESLAPFCELGLRALAFPDSLTSENGESIVQNPTTPTSRSTSLPLQVVRKLTISMGQAVPFLSKMLSKPLLLPISLFSQKPRYVSLSISA